MTGLFDATNYYQEIVSIPVKGQRLRHENGSLYAPFHGQSIKGERLS